MNSRATVFVGLYVLLSVVVAWAFRSFLAAGHDTMDIPRIWLIVLGPMVTLAVGHGVEIYILATLVVLPLGVVALTRRRRGLAAVYGASALGAWLCFGFLLS